MLGKTAREGKHHGEGDDDHGCCPLSAHQVHGIPKCSFLRPYPPVKQQLQHNIS